MATHSTLNVGSAFSYLVLVLMLHATLFALVAGGWWRTCGACRATTALTGLLNRRAWRRRLSEQLRHGRAAARCFQ